MAGRTKEITFTFERFGEDGWFFARCNEIPGMLLFGPTTESVEAQLLGALKLITQARAEEFSHATLRKPATRWHRTPPVTVELAAAS